MIVTSSIKQRLKALCDEDMAEVLRPYPHWDRNKVLQSWRGCARPQQLPPDGEWRTWLVMAGRGFGKTRAGAEWVRHTAYACPGAHIAIIGATLHEVRSIMVEAVREGADLVTLRACRGGERGRRRARAGPGRTDRCESSGRCRRATRTACRMA